LVKNGATRCQILRLKCIKFDFRSRPRWGVYSALPDPLAVFKGPTSKGGGRGRGRGREGEGKGREGMDEKGRGELAPNWGVWIRQ